MREPAPWSKQDTTELEHQLLDAAREDHLPEAMKLRMAEALTALPPLAASGSTLRPVSSGAGGRLLFSHPGLWGALSAAILAGAVGWRALSHSGVVSSARPRVESTAQLTAANPVASPQPADLPPLAAEVPEPLLASSANSAAAQPRRESASEPPLHLREELALLDATRAALAARQTVRALRLLDQHAEQFSRGWLAPEADALRIDTLVQQGSTERAERLSRRFLERYPTHPLAAHIASIAQARLRKR